MIIYQHSGYSVSKRHVHYQIHKAVSELCKHVIILCPVQVGPQVVSSLVCRSGESASLSRLHSNTDCCHVVWLKLLFSKDNINTVFRGDSQQDFRENIFIPNSLPSINNIYAFPVCVCIRVTETTCDFVTLQQMFGAIDASLSVHRPESSCIQDYTLNGN